MNLPFGSGESMSSRFTTNPLELKRGDLSSFDFSLSKMHWTRGMPPTSACLTTSGLARPAVRTSNDVQRCASQALVLPALTSRALRSRYAQATGIPLWERCRFSDAVPSRLRRRQTWPPRILLPGVFSLHKSSGLEMAAHPGQETISCQLSTVSIRNRAASRPFASMQAKCSPWISALTARTESAK